MAERKFDYQQVGDIYQSMLKTIGSAGDGESIAGILDSLNKEMDARVNVEDEAIFGSLGAQLSLDWDNASSNFPGFVSKFSNWATLIAQSGANYSEFENDIKGFKKEDEGTYLGAASGGIHENYVATSTYNQYQAQNMESYLNSLDNVRELNQLTGATYLTTDSEGILKRHQIFATAVGIADIAAVIWTGMAAYGIAGGTAAGTELVPSNPTPTGPTGGSGTGAPQLPAHETPLLTGGGRGLPIDEFATKVALTNPGSAGTEALLNMANQAQAAGATMASWDSTVPNILQFFDGAGKLIAEANGTTGVFTLF